MLVEKLQARNPGFALAWNAVNAEKCALIHDCRPSGETMIASDKAFL
jgi:hypothetical protein